MNNWSLAEENRKMYLFLTAILKEEIMRNYYLLLKQLRLNIVILFVTAFFIPAMSQEVDTLIPSDRDTLFWLSLHWPPLMILKGENAGEGRMDKAVALYKKALPQYIHIDKVMNWARFWTSVKHGENICTPLALKTPKHRDQLHFSLPVGISPTHRIYMKKSNIERLGNPKSISLAQLVQDSTLKTIIQVERSYTPQLDTIFNEYRDSSNFIVRVHTTEQLMGMLELDRITYLVEYPSVFSYYSPRYITDKSEIGSIAIDEIKPYTLYYLGCTANEWGKETVREIDEMLRTLLPSEEYQNLIGSTLDEEIRTIVKQAFQEEILSNIE